MPIPGMSIGQTAAWIKMKLGTEVGLGPGHIVLDGDPTPLPQRGTAPAQFSAHVHCGHWPHGWMDRCHLVRRSALAQATLGSITPKTKGGGQPPKKGEGTAPPPFLANVSCGKTAGCIKMPLGMEVEG